MQFIAQCSLCRHLDRTDRGRTVCVAFPEGIPEAILDNRVDHRRGYPGDRGVRFARASDAPAGLQATPRWTK